MNTVPIRWGGYVNILIGVERDLSNPIFLSRIALLNLITPITLEELVEALINRVLKSEIITITDLVSHCSPLWRIEKRYKETFFTRAELDETCVIEGINYYTAISECTQLMHVLSTVIANACMQIPKVEESSRIGDCRVLKIQGHEVFIELCVIEKGDSNNPSYLLDSRELR